MSYNPNFAGIVDSDINSSSSSSGNIVNSGKIKNITTTAVFGDILFLSKTGDITNTKPSIGVGGFVSGDQLNFRVDRPA